MSVLYSLPQKVLEFSVGALGPRHLAGPRRGGHEVLVAAARVPVVPRAVVGHAEAVGRGGHW